jgi:hypothetical protein
MLDELRSVVSQVDTASALLRLKNQGAAFSRAYYEFAMLKNISMTHPIVWAEWQRLDKLAGSVQGIMSVLNSRLDTVNGFAEAMFGEQLNLLMGDFLNAYILSSIATLKFITENLVNFNKSIVLPTLQKANPQ